MPADPREYRILQNLQTALKGILINAGYHHNVAATAVKLDPDQGVEQLVGATKARPFVVLEPGAERWDWNNSEKPNGILLFVPYTVYFVNQADQTIDENLLKTYFRGLADVEQAVAVDPSRGNLAVFSRVIKRTFSAVGGEVWSIVDVEVELRRTYGAPNG